VDSGWTFASRDRMSEGFVRTETIESARAGCGETRRKKGQGRKGESGGVLGAIEVRRRWGGRPEDGCGGGGVGLEAARGGVEGVEFSHAGLRSWQTNFAQRAGPRWDLGTVAGAKGGREEEVKCGLQSSILESHSRRVKPANRSRSAFVGVGKL